MLAERLAEEFYTSEEGRALEARLVDALLASRACQELKERVQAAVDRELESNPKLFLQDRGRTTVELADKLEVDIRAGDTLLGEAIGREISNLLDGAKSEVEQSLQSLCKHSLPPETHGQREPREPHEYRPPHHRRYPHRRPLPRGPFRGRN